MINNRTVNLHAAPARQPQTKPQIHILAVAKKPLIKAAQLLKNLSAIERSSSAWGEAFAISRNIFSRMPESTAIGNARCMINITDAI